MRRFLATAAVAAVVGAASLISTTAQAIGPVAFGPALERIDPIRNVARVCREVCNGDICRRRCFNRLDYNEGYTERRIYQERYRAADDRRRYWDYDRGPGVRFQLGLD